MPALFALPDVLPRILIHRRTAVLGQLRSDYPGGFPDPGEPGQVPVGVLDQVDLLYLEAFPLIFVRDLFLSLRYVGLAESGIASNGGKEKDTTNAERQ